MKIVERDSVFDCVHSKFIGLSEAESTLDSASSHPQGEPFMVMASSKNRFLFSFFLKWSSSKFSSPDDQCFIKKASGFQVSDKCGNALISSSGIISVIVYKASTVSMCVPFSALSSVKNFNKANS